MYFAVALLALLIPADARAYELDMGTPACAGNSQWSLSGYSGFRDEPVYTPCFPLNWTNNSHVSFSELVAAAAHSYSQWNHDGQSRMRLAFQQNQCTSHSLPNNGSWNDNGNEVSEIWWSNVSTFTGGSGVWGQEQTDQETCFLFGDEEYLASDVDITDAVGVLAAESNSMADCLSNQPLVEDVNLHEIGHSYGIKHNDAWLTVMNSFTGPSHRKCDSTANWAVKPWSDETQAMMYMYGVANWNQVVDVTVLTSGVVEGGGLYLVHTA